MKNDTGATVESTDEGPLTPKKFQEKYNCGKTRMYEELATGRLKGKKNGTSTLITNAPEWLANLPDYEANQAAAA